MGSATLRRHAAFVGAWEGGLAYVAEENHVPSAAQLRDTWPALWAALETADAGLAAQTSSSLPPPSLGEGVASSAT